jgi:hypothetical protein
MGNTNRSDRKRDSMEDLLTFSEAIEALGNIAPSSFKALVDNEKIRKVVPPGKTQGKYVAEDVYKLAEERKPFQFAERSRKSSPRKSYRDNKSHVGATDWASDGDLPYMLAYDLEMYGLENTVDIKITHEWWRKNPYMARLLFNADDRREIWGGITIMPMKEETIMRILTDEMTEKDIRPKHILTYEHGQKYVGYVASATVKKEYATHFRELLQSVFDFACSQYPEVQITKLYAYASSPEGWDLIKRLFFTPRRDINRNAFELDIFERNPSPYLKAFQDCLKAKGATIFEPEW